MFKSKSQAQAKVETVDTVTIAAPSAKARVRAVAASAFLIGTGLVFMVGFAHSDVMHNAAHDTRHTLAFPCH